MKIFLVCSILIFLFAHAENTLPLISQAATDLPATPFLASWCEGKDCEHRYSKHLNCKAELLNDAKLSAKKIADLKKGEVIDTRIYYTKVIEIGSYLPLEAPKRSLVSEVRPNVYVTFFDHAWDSVIDPPRDHLIKPITEPWALVKTKSGQTGFLKMDSTSDSSSNKKSFHHTCPFQLEHNI